MSDQIEKRAKKAKEISDLKSEIQKIMDLLNSGQWDELADYLQELREKYSRETILHNIANPIPPKNTIEDAQNGLSFLSTLLAKKIADTEDNK